MIYYHGTTKSFRNFDLSKACNYKDFGKGIYLTQESWHALSVAKRQNMDNNYIMKYDLDIEYMRKNLNVKEFKKTSVEWVKFVVENRNKLFNSGYDVVIGATADASAQRIIEEFYRFSKHRKIGRKEYRELISKLEAHKYPTQMCLLTNKAVDYVNSRYIGRSNIKESR